MYLRYYFIFTQLKATLRAGWKGARVGGERAEDGEAILLGRCLEKLGPALAVAEDSREAAGLKGPGAILVFDSHLYECLYWVILLHLSFSFEYVSCRGGEPAPERCLGETEFCWV